MTFAGNNFWYATPYLKRYPWKSGPKQIWQKSENVIQKKSCGQVNETIDQLYLLRGIPWKYY